MREKLLILQYRVKDFTRSDFPNLEITDVNFIVRPRAPINNFWHVDKFYNRESWDVKKERHIDDISTSGNYRRILVELESDKKSTRFRKYDSRREINNQKSIQNLAKDGNRWMIPKL